MADKQQQQQFIRDAGGVYRWIFNGQALTPPECEEAGVDQPQIITGLDKIHRWGGTPKAPGQPLTASEARDWGRTQPQAAPEANEPIQAAEATETAPEAAPEANEPAEAPEAAPEAPEAAPEETATLVVGIEQPIRQEGGTWVSDLTGQPMPATLAVDLEREYQEAQAQDWEQQYPTRQADGTWIHLPSGKPVSPVLAHGLERQRRLKRLDRSGRLARVEEEFPRPDRQVHTA